MMTRDDANRELAKIMDQNHGSVYCKAELNSYGKPAAIYLSGEFSFEDLQLIATIALAIEP